MKNFYPDTHLRRSILLFSTLLAIGTMIYSCKKSPTDGVSLVVNTNIIKYSVEIQVKDAADSSKIPTNVQLSISGQDADNVYEISGKKNFTIHNGKIQIGLNPALIPVMGRPASFNLELSADGYLPLTQEVQIAGGQTAQTLKINMLNINTPPANLKLVQQDVDASTGALVNDETVKIADGQAPFTASIDKTVTSSGSTTIYADNALATVVLPAGTKFYYFKFIKTGTATGTRTIPVYAKKDTTVTVTTTPVPNFQPITGTGVSQFTPPPTTTTYTYRPYVDSVIFYQYDLGYTVPVTYTGKVHVICQYDFATQVTNTASVFPYNMFKPRPITMLDNSTVSEDELLYTNATSITVKDIYFVGTVGGKTLMISPTNDINGNSARAFTWRASSIIDPNVINPYTGVKIKEGDKVDVGIDYKKSKTVQALVQKVRGQLRVETRSGNGGFYHKAKSIQAYSFGVNPVPQSDIPDSYNIRVWSGSISCGPVSWSFNNFTPEDAPPYFYGKVISDQALTSPVLSYSLSYFDFRYFTTANNFTTVNFFTGLTGLYPLSSLDVSLTCTGDPSKPITVKPTYSDYLYYNGYNSSFAVHLNQGLFATRGLPSGTVVSASGWVGDTQITFSVPMNAGVNTANVSFGYKDNKICDTF